VSASHGGPPWRWEIVNAAGWVVAAGVQWTHPLARPEYVAGERIAVVAYRLLRAGRRDELAGMVCRVRRPGERDAVEVSARVWVRRAEAAARRAAAGKA
jgi:hypothetical protein